MAKKMPEEVYKAVFDRAESDTFDVRCEVMVKGCCTARATHWHHRKLRSQGGKHEVVNGLAVCSSCHTFIHMHPAIAYSNGWIVQSVADPALVPVVRRGRTVRLYPDGLFRELVS